MPTVLRVGAYRFFFFSRETGEPAHIHIEAGGKEAKVWLANIHLAMSYGFKAHEIAELLALVKEYKEIFLEAWHEFFSPKS
jgi:hypothetical protein